MGALAEPFALTAPEARQLTPMDLLQTLIQTHNPKDAIEVAKELTKMHMELRRQAAEEDFTLALSLCQSEVKFVVADAKGVKEKPFATYKALDRAIRPIYLRYGLSLSFDSGPCDMPGYMTAMCHVSKGLHTRIYQLPMDISGLGPKGEGALSRPHAVLGGVEYGRRALLKMIFNIVTGEEDVLTNGELMANIEQLFKAPNIKEMGDMHQEFYQRWKDYPAAIGALQEARNKRHKELKNAAH